MSVFDEIGGGYGPAQAGFHSPFGELTSPFLNRLDYFNGQPGSADWTANIPINQGLFSLLKGGYGAGQDVWAGGQTSPLPLIYQFLNEQRKIDPTLTIDNIQQAPGAAFSVHKPLTAYDISPGPIYGDYIDPGPIGGPDTYGGPGPIGPVPMFGIQPSYGDPDPIYPGPIGVPDPIYPGPIGVPDVGPIGQELGPGIDPIFGPIGGPGIDPIFGPGQISPNPFTPTSVLEVPDNYNTGMGGMGGLPTTTLPIGSGVINDPYPHPFPGPTTLPFTASGNTNVDASDAEAMAASAGVFGGPANFSGFGW